MAESGQQRDWTHGANDVEVKLKANGKEEKGNPHRGQDIESFFRGDEA